MLALSMIINYYIITIKYSGIDLVCEAYDSRSAISTFNIEFI